MTHLTIYDQMRRRPDYVNFMLTAQAKFTACEEPVLTSVTTLSGAFEAVLFDLGDTIIHFETQRITAILNRSCRTGYDRLLKSGHQLPKYDRYFSALRRRLLTDWLCSQLTRREVQLVPSLDRVHRRLGANLTDAELADVMRDASTPVIQGMMTVDEEAHHVLQELRNLGLFLGVVSNTCFPAESIDDYLSAHGLLEFFPLRIYSSDVRYMKPSPHIFHKALDQLNVTAASKVLFVGDRLDTDVKGASRVGMKTVHFRRNGNGRRRNWLVRPDYRIDSLSEILRIVNPAD
ncbi:MAG: HAD family hydrolase [Phycisphaerae bacterium]